MYRAHGKCASNMNRAWHCCIYTATHNTTHVRWALCDVYLWMMPSIYTTIIEIIAIEKNATPHRTKAFTIKLTSLTACEFVGMSFLFPYFPLRFPSCLLQSPISLLCFGNFSYIVLAFDIPLAAKMFDYGHLSPFAHKPGQSFYRMRCSFSPLRL